MKNFEKNYEAIKNANQRPDKTLIGTDDIIAHALDPSLNYITDKPLTTAEKAYLAAGTGVEVDGRDAFDANMRATKELFAKANSSGDMIISDNHGTYHRVDWSDPDDIEALKLYYARERKRELSISTKLDAMAETARERGVIL